MQKILTKFVVFCVFFYVCLFLYFLIADDKMNQADIFTEIVNSINMLLKTLDDETMSVSMRNSAHEPINQFDCNHKSDDEIIFPIIEMSPQPQNVSDLLETFAIDTPESCVDYIYLEADDEMSEIDDAPKKKKLIHFKAHKNAKHFRKTKSMQRGQFIKYARNRPHNIAYFGQTLCPRIQNAQHDNGIHYNDRGITMYSDQLRSDIQRAPLPAVGGPRTLDHIRVENIVIYADRDTAEETEQDQNHIFPTETVDETNNMFQKLFSLIICGSK